MFVASSSSSSSSSKILISRLRRNSDKKYQLHRLFAAGSPALRSIATPISPISHLATFLRSLRSPPCARLSAISPLARPLSSPSPPLPPPRPAFFGPIRRVSFDRDRFISRFSAGLALIPRLFHLRVVPRRSPSSRFSARDLCALLLYRRIKVHKALFQ
jgi:hypothetical protein